MRLPVYLLIFLLGISHMHCSERESFSEERFIIRKNQTVRVNQLDLSITNRGCGRQWIDKAAGQGYERPYCDIEVRRGDKVSSAGEDFEPVYIGNLMVQVEKMNPWERLEDSIPPGGCKVLVKLLDSR